MIISLLTSLILSSSPINYIVIIEGANKNFEWHGTGFLIEKNLLMTAAHVTSRENQKLTAVCDNKKILIDNKKIFIDSSRDLAIIELPEQCVSDVIDLATDNPEISEPILTIGCPESIAYCGMVTKGIVSLYRHEFRRLRMYSDMRIWYGNSGGPVLDRTKRLVGVLIEIRSWSKSNTKKVEDVVEQNYAVVTPISEILDFIKEFKVSKEPK